MKNYLAKKDKYFSEYATGVMSVFYNLKYGISKCPSGTDMDLLYMRYELAKWQESSDFSSMSEIVTNYKSWLPVNIYDDEMCYVNININNNYMTGSKSFHVTPSSIVWTLVHNLGFNPNITTTNEAGQEISGTVEYVDINTIKVTFSEPLSGWAYLS